MASVLVVDDEVSLREGIVLALEATGHRVSTAGTLAEARRRLRAASFDCMLLDIRLPDGNGIDLLEEAHETLAPDTPIIMATASGDSARTIAAIKAGAFDYLKKPFDLRALVATVERALRSRDPSRSRSVSPCTPIDAVSSDPVDPRSDRLIGGSAAMVAVWKAIGRISSSDAPVLVLGETGTGKEVVARAIHDHSTRAKEPFIAVNLASLAPSLVESELMGHEKGAFTGAIRRRVGRIELAGRGTLFLDEIGDLDAALQTKLLRVLQDGAFERVGGSETLTSKARIVAATNKAVRPGDAAPTLREDLYYRLAVVEIDVPPLRERRSDILSSSRTPSLGRRRVRSPRPRWIACSRTRGPATFASSSTSSSVLL